MNKTSNILSKNFRILFNTKATTLIILLGPLFLIGIIGLALHDTSMKNIQAGIYGEGAEQEFLEGIQSKLYIESINSKIYKDLGRCKEDVKNELIQMCLELKPLTTGTFGENNQEIVLHVDYSKQRTVWNLIGRIQGMVDDETKSYQEESINDLKEEMQELKKILEKTNHDLNSIYSELKSAIDYLEDLEQLLDEIEYMKEEINNLESLIEESPLTEYESMSLKLTLNSIQSDLSKISNQINSYNIENQKNKLTSVIDKLDEIEREIIQMERKIDSIGQTDVDRLMNPITLRHQSVMSSSKSGTVTDNLEFLDYLFPSFLIFFILFDSIIFSATTRIKDRKSNAYIRNVMSKNKPRNILLGDFITSVIIISIQITAIIMLSSLFLNLSIINNLESIIILTILSVGIFSFIGVAIGSIFNTQESTIITSISISLLLFIFSSLITPIETLPKAVGQIVKNTPLALLESKLRMTTIFNLPLTFSSSETFALIFTTIFLLGITAYFYKRNKTKEI